jgi:DNA-binding transcriptional LysR family regulator
LFDRVGRGVRLTSQGEDLLRHSRRLLAEFSSLSERARALKGDRLAFFAWAPRLR